MTKTGIGGNPRSLRSSVGFDRTTPAKGIGFDHREISRDIRKGLASANKTINTAERFGNHQVYKSSEAKLRHARDDLNSIKPYRVSRASALRHAIGFDSTSRAQREEHFVNLYRRNFGSNAGLSSKEIHSWSDKRLDENIRSHERLAKINDKVGFDLRHHPANCQCPFHGGHKGRKGGIGYDMKGIGFSGKGAIGGMPRRL